MSDTPFEVGRTRLPEGFQFSQSSLQDYKDCPRRFQLRYMLEYAWPAVESEPALEREQFLEMGNRFHRLAQQLLAGVPPEALRRAAGEAGLRDWLDNFTDFVKKHDLLALSERRVEFELSAPLGNFRLAAKYDLVIRSPEGGFTIYDWKTSARPHERRRLAERMQTRVYPYLLARAGAGLNGGRPVEPGMVELVYWFAAFTDEEARFPYSGVQFEQDEAYLQDLVDEIARMEDFPLTHDERRCAFCVYRSLCGRGEGAGLLDEREAEDDAAAFEAGFDFDQIAEIEF